MDETGHATQKTNSSAELEQKCAEKYHERDWRLLESIYQTTISSANNALRTLVIIHGGAVIALLAFIGNVMSSEKYDNSSIVLFSDPLLYFCLGIAAVILSMAFAYFTSYCLGTSIAERNHQYQYPYVVHTKKSKNWHVASAIAEVFAVMLGFVSLGLFVYGMVEARDALRALQPAAVAADAMSAPSLEQQ